MGVARRTTWLRYPFDEEFAATRTTSSATALTTVADRCDPAIESTYRGRGTIASLWRQYFGYGCWKVRVIQAHPRQVRLRHLAPATLVTTLAGGALLGTVSRRARRIAALELGLYAAATAAAAIRYRDRSRPTSTVALAAVFPVVHLSYGTGMLRGIWMLARSRGIPVAQVPGHPDHREPSLDGEG